MRSTAATKSGLSRFVGSGSVLASVGGSFAWGVVSQFAGFLMSPFVLLWIYLLWRPDFSSFGAGLRSRQNFRRQLEAATLNPRDADAQYQLGLIYQQRRNYTEAIARFQKAVEIDRTDPDPHFQLGKIAREQGRHQEARGWFARAQSAAASTDAATRSYVFELSARASMLSGDQAAALDAIERRVEALPHTRVQLRLNPEFAPLRSNPRFQKLTSS